MNVSGNPLDHVESWKKVKNVKHGPKPIQNRLGADVSFRAPLSRNPGSESRFFCVLVIVGCVLWSGSGGMGLVASTFLATSSAKGALKKPCEFV